jgi:cytochrome oxidase Cu insertion factor (SCO1/SenC/PrrC family)
VVLMAITMQPEKDTPELLSQIARFYRLDEYNAHLLTGDVDYVNICWTE